MVKSHRVVSALDVDTVIINAVSELYTEAARPYFGMDSQGFLDWDGKLLKVKL